MPTYDTSTGIRALQGSNVVADVDAGFLAMAQDVATLVAAAVAAAEPAGTIKATARATAPTGFLLCDGAAVSRTTYAVLFAAIGTAFGTGDGSTTFNLPDLRGRVPVGVDGAAARMAASDTLGASAGAEKVTLTDNEMPQTEITGGGAVVTMDASGGTGGRNLAYTAMSTFSGSHLKLSGGGAAHVNMPPYQVVNWMVKT